MKKILILLFAILLSTLCLASCTSGDAPKGMKSAYNSSEAEFKLYVPNSWIIDSMNKISSAHVSDRDSTGISLKKTSYTSEAEWWSDFKASITSTFTDVSFITEDSDTVISGLNAKKNVFTASFTANSSYKYELYGIKSGDHVFEIMIKYEGITSNGSTTYTDEKYKDDIKKILDYVSFNNKPTESSDNIYEAESVPSGMKCASDVNIVDYYLFVPENWIVEKNGNAVSSAYVSESDKTNVSVMQWNVSTRDDYDYWWNEYKLQLYSAFDYSAIPLSDNGTVIADANGKVEYKESSIINVSEEGTAVSLNSNEGRKYTYSVKIDGTVYDFSVYALLHNASVYVMTFTFKQESDKSLYQADIDKILNNFRFS